MINFPVKLTSSIVSSFLLSILISFTTLSQLEGTLSYSYIIMHGMLVLLPIYVFIGIPVSYLIDAIIRQFRVMKPLVYYVAVLLMYLLGGSLIGIVGLLLIPNKTSMDGAFTFLLSFLLASILFVHIQFILRPVILATWKLIWRRFFDDEKAI